MILFASMAMADPVLAEGTNRHFHHSMVTTADPDQIWRLWTDVSTWYQWDTGLQSATLEGPFQQDAQGSLISDGRETTFTVSDFQPQRSYAFTTKLPLGSLIVTRTLDQPEAGQTRFTHDVAFTGLGGRLLSAMLGRRFRIALPQAMQQLAHLAESQEPT